MVVGYLFWSGESMNCSPINAHRQVLFLHNPFARITTRLTGIRWSTQTRSRRSVQPIVEPRSSSPIPVSSRQGELAAGRCQSDLHHIMKLLNRSVVPVVLKMMNPRLIIVNIKQQRTFPIHVEVLDVIRHEARFILCAFFRVNTATDRNDIEVCCRGCRRTCISGEQYSLNQ